MGPLFSLLVLVSIPYLYRYKYGGKGLTPFPRSPLVTDAPPILGVRDRPTPLEEDPTGRERV